MIQLYAALLYCVGACHAASGVPPPEAPDGLILYGTLKDCEAHKHGFISAPQVPYHYVEHCARIYVDRSFWRVIAESQK